jgi:hypothetical protein
MRRRSRTEEGNTRSLLSLPSGGAVGRSNGGAKEAEKELHVMVEGTHEGLARGWTRCLLERRKGVACGC